MFTCFLSIAFAFSIFLCVSMLIMEEVHSPHLMDCVLFLRKRNIHTQSESHRPGMLGFITRTIRLQPEKCFLPAGGSQEASLPLALCCCKTSLSAAEASLVFGSSSLMESRIWMLTSGGPSDTLRFLPFRCYRANGSGEVASKSFESIK